MSSSNSRRNRGGGGPVPPTMTSPGGQQYRYYGPGQQSHDPQHQPGGGGFGGGGPQRGPQPLSQQQQHQRSWQTRPRSGGQGQGQGQGQGGVNNANNYNMNNNTHYRAMRAHAFWASPPFPGILGARVIGQKGQNFKDLTLRYPAIQFNLREVSKSKHPDLDGPMVLTLSPQRDYNGPFSDYFAQRSEVQALLTDLLASPANWAWRDSEHLLAAPEPTQRLCWTSMHDHELLTKLPAALDSPPPYFFMSVARPTDDEESERPHVNEGLERALEAMAFDPRDAAARSMQVMHLQSDDRITALAESIAERNKTFMYTAVPGGPSSMKLKAALGMLVYSRFLMGGVLGDACKDGATFTAAAAVQAVNSKDIKGSYAVGLPVSAEPPLLRFLSALSFKSKGSESTKVVAAFRMPDSTPRALAFSRIYKMKFVYDENIDEFVFHPTHLQYESVPLGKYAVVMLPQDRGAETELPLSFRVRHFVNEPVPENLQSATRERLDLISNELLAFLNGARDQLLGHDDEHISPALPALPTIVVEKTTDLTLRLKKTTRHERGQWSMSCIKVAALASRTPPASIPIASLLAVQFKHAGFSSLDVTQTKLSAHYVKMFIDVMQSFTRGVRREIGAGDAIAPAPVSIAAAIAPPVRAPPPLENDDDDESEEGDDVDEYGGEDAGDAPEDSDESDSAVNGVDHGDDGGARDDAADGSEDAYDDSGNMDDDAQDAHEDAMADTQSETAVQSEQGEHYELPASSPAMGGEADADEMDADQATKDARAVSDDSLTSIDENDGTTTFEE
ncbi:hypothetical protein BC828DRAFT_390354 [Blastocladiella britannica]|nr:hypothetical protein BC828DRAFT_390354 [Blastocladiella britannica]